MGLREVDTMIHIVSEGSEAQKDKEIWPKSQCCKTADACILFHNVNSFLRFYITQCGRYRIIGVNQPWLFYMNLNKLINPSEFQFAENWVSNVDEQKCTT